MHVEFINNFRELFSVHNNNTLLWDGVWKQVIVRGKLTGAYLGKHSNVYNTQKGIYLIK